jgi:hypothetical protein
LKAETRRKKVLKGEIITEFYDVFQEDERM